MRNNRRGSKVCRSDLLTDTAKDGASFTGAGVLHVGEREKLPKAA
jgi:hypothetical protein